MTKSSLLNDNELIRFDKTYNTSHEDAALNMRGDFVKKFPLNKLKNITLDDYVIGYGTNSFCTMVEVKTRKWASIQGSPANKFGVYYGKTSIDKTKDYRFTKRFGKSTDEAFNNIKSTLLDLVEAGKSKDFEAIDKNLLSQMFKAKILSLYFPDIYLNVCSSEHIEDIALQLGIPEVNFISEYQHLLYVEKLNNKITKEWSNPKFMAFLYAKFIDRESDKDQSSGINKPNVRVHRTVDFDELNSKRSAIGKKSEAFAIEWEKSRLIGLGLDSLADKIADYTNKPGYGYDFLSYNSLKSERYIEVKTVGYDRKEGCSRFYLSDNEFKISQSLEVSDDYYFYLVSWKNDEATLIAKRAKDIYLNSEKLPCAYIVRFELISP